MIRMFRLFFFIATCIAMTSCVQPHFIAHRGASYLAPENTQESLDLAWELKAAGAECDVMVTKDKQIILFHDDDGNRLLGQDVIIAETKYVDLKGLPIYLKASHQEKYEGAAIPLLKDVLMTLPKDQLLVIEIKDDIEIIPYLVEVIDNYWRQGKIAFIAFDFETILSAKKRYPKVPSYYLSSSLNDVNSRFDAIASSDLDGVDLHHKIIDGPLVKRFKAIGKSVWCWTVNTPEDARRMLQAGVKYITTDRPAWLATQLQNN